MKKIMAIVLVAAMIMAVMPTAFATSKTVMDPREAARGVERLDVNDGANVKELSFGRSHSGQSTINPASVDKKYQSIERSKGWMDDIELMGIGVIDPADASTSGYWFTAEDEDFIIPSDNPSFDGDAYGMCLVPATSEGVYTYAKGELMYFNFDLYQNFNTTTGELVSLPDREDGYGVAAWIYAGHLEDESYPLVGAWSSSQGGLSVNLVAPDDDYVYMIYLFAEKVDEFSQGWGGWFTLSTADGVLRDMKVGEDMKVGTELRQNITSADKLCAVPVNESYIPEYGQLHKIELEGGKKYMLSFTSEETEIYTHLLFLTENMDIIAERAAVNEDGYNLMRVFPTESGTYYIGMAGLEMDQEGEVALRVDEWDDCEYTEGEYPEIDEVIDLGSFGAEEHHGIVDGVDGYIWDYAYSTQNNYGILIVGGLAGNYTIQGDAQDVIVIAYDGARVILDNAAVEAVMLENYYAPVTIAAKGSSKITNPEGYAMMNEEGYLAGVYFTGDEITIEGIFGIVLEGAPITLAAKKLVVDTTSMEGYYNIAMWVMGVNLPSVALGKNAKFDGKNRVSTMSYDPDGYFPYGYGISEQEELYRPNHEGFGWEEGVMYFELTTDGLNDNQNVGLVGDANGDGKVNTGDATQVLKYAAGMITLEGELLANADTNGDGKVNTGDATMILKYAAGMISEFPVH